MSKPVGEWTGEQLRAAVVVPEGMTTARPATITVDRIDRTGPDREGVLAEIVVRHAEGVERWRLIFDSTWVDVCDFPLQDAALMVRTNIEEWWDTQGQGSDPVWLTARKLSS